MNFESDEEVIQFSYVKPRKKFNPWRCSPRVKVTFEELDGELEQNAITQKVSEVPLLTASEIAKLWEYYSYHPC